MLRHFFILLQFFFFAIKPCQAAYPIVASTEQSQNSRAAQPNKYYNTHSEDMGVFGILAIIFAVTGLFPLAIASGIIGTQNGRKFKGLARAGFFLGILVGMVFAGYLLYLFILG